MKQINNYISEKLIINNNNSSHQEEFEDADEYLSFIVEQSKKDPDIWDDTCSWEARDSFEYWEGAWGLLMNMLVINMQQVGHQKNHLKMYMILFRKF